MKLKEIPRTATFAWSPDPEVPVIFTGTAAGAIDADFSTSSRLEKWSVDLLQSSPTHFRASEIAHVETESRFTDLAVSEDGKFVVGTQEGGVVSVWKADDLSLVHTNDTAHSSSVHTVAFNRKDSQRFATGGSHGELFVWNLDDLSSPIAAGTSSSQNHDEIKSVAWNNTASHILASAGTKGFTTIWDTKRRKEVLHLHYTSPSGNRVPFSSVQWHPFDTTKLVTASVDDNEPVICLWDLKNANSPEKVMRGHTKGVLSLDWCRFDENLLLSGGRDDSSRLWNPMEGTELGAYPLSVEWAFKTRFHPRLPDIFASASFDGKISIQSLQDTHGGSEKKTTNKSGNDFWETEDVMDAVHPSFVLQQAPRWLSRPISARFGFGGKLVIAREGKIEVKRISDNAFDLNGAKSLSDALKGGSFTEIIEDNKSDETWTIISQVISGEDVLDLGQSEEDAEKSDDEDEFNVIPQYAPTSDFKMLDSSLDASISKLMLNGDYEKAVSKLVDAGEVGDALLIASYGGPELIARCQNAYLSKFGDEKSYLRAAWSISNNNIDDLVDHAELSAWPEVLKYALKQTDQKLKDAASAKLSDRLAQAGEKENAIKVCLVSQNTGAVASLWLDELPQLEKKILEKGDSTAYSAHASALQQIVQRIAAVTTKFGLPSIKNPGAARLYSAFRDFADLASQHGDLELAKLFLDMLPEEFAAEKQRVNVATNQTSSAGRTERKNTTGRAATSNVAAYPLPSTPLTATPVKKMTTVRAAPSNFVPHDQTKGSAPTLNGMVPPMAASTNPLPVITPTILPPVVPGVGISPARASLAASLNDEAAATDAQIGADTPAPPPSSQNGHGTGAGWNDIVELPMPSRKAYASPKVVPPTRAAAATVAPPLSAQVPPVLTPGVPVVPAPHSHQPGVGPQANAAPTARAPAPRANPYASRSTTTRASSSTRTNAYAPANDSGSPAPAALYGRPPSRPYSTEGNVPIPAAAHAVVPPPPSVGPSAGAASTMGAVPPPPRSSNFRQTVVPPPAAAVQPPPQSTTSHVPAPPSSSLPPVSNVPAPVAAAPAPIRSPISISSTPVSANRVPKKPVDPKAIPAVAQPVYAAFNAELERVRPVIEVQYGKQYKDTVRRLDILYDQFTVPGSISADTIEKLVLLSNSIVGRDYNNANAALQDISTNHSSEVGEWMTGVKRLIKMSAGVPV